jgi:hypothetical protein
MNHRLRSSLLTPARMAMITRRSLTAFTPCSTVSAVVTFPASSLKNAIVSNYIIRYSSTSQPRPYGTSTSTCPFQILGLPKQTEYRVVKKQFLKLALKHHPDTAVTNKGDKKAMAKAIELFMNVRKAFEQIIELEDGIAGIRTNSEKSMDGKEFNNWFYRETGKYAPDPFDLNLSPETLQEVAEASASQAGLDRY